MSKGALQNGDYRYWSLLEGQDRNQAIMCSSFCSLIFAKMVYEHYDEARAWWKMLFQPGVGASLASDLEVTQIEGGTE